MKAEDRKKTGPWKGRRRIAWIAGTTVVVLGLTGTVTYAMVRPEDDSLAQVPGTTQVVRTTLVDMEQVDGALQYEPARTLTAAGDAGILTWLPEEGEAIARGETVYRADDDPRVLMYGNTPFYREMSQGDRGKDVAVLESNLAELGYSGFTEDDCYTWATAQVVRQWQRDEGLEQTGEVGPGQVVVTSGKVRVGDVLAELGGSAGGDVLELTHTQRTVGVDLEVRRSHMVDEDGEVEIELPDGEVLDAEVEEIGGSVEAAEDSDSLEDATVPVTVLPVDEEELGDYDIAPVTVNIEAGRAEDVLAVPVEALVALREGGHGVQTVGADGSTDYVAVETGEFADGLVEVSGEGLEEGQEVGVPE